MNVVCRGRKKPPPPPPHRHSHPPPVYFLDSRNLKPQKCRVRPLSTFGERGPSWASEMSRKFRKNQPSFILPHHYQGLTNASYQVIVRGFMCFIQSSYITVFYTGILYRFSYVAIIQAVYTGFLCKVFYIGFIRSFYAKFFIQAFYIGFYTGFSQGFHTIGVSQYIVLYVLQSRYYI